MEQNVLMRGRNPRQKFSLEPRLLHTAVTLMSQNTVRSTQNMEQEGKSCRESQVESIPVFIP